MRILHAILIPALVLLLAAPPGVDAASITGTITALNGTVVLPLAPEINTVGMQLSGTWTATVVFEASMDGGTTWFSVYGQTASTGDFVTSTGVTCAGTCTFQVYFPVGTYDTFRARASAFTSGTVNLSVQIRPATQGASGTDRITGGSSPKNSTQNGVNAAVTATITGVASQTVYITRIDATCSAGTATLIITDGGTTVYSLPAAASFALPFGFPGMTLGIGNTAVVTLAACGVSNTGTLNVAAMQY